MLQILLDHLFCHLADRGAEVPSRPEMPAPVPFLHVRKLFKQLTRGAPLDPPHDLTRRHGRWTTRQNVDVILAHHALYDSDLKGFARLAHQLSYAVGDIAREHLVAVLRHPHKV